eukprot:TRINITY_DN19810_c0_g1_i2.p1 TRINITY_DN19810_c0_g1~~TRINITY_DN19810_c0_g1_i2.p1  ORF type:complete len:115 (-),score=33.97 TRINITY_DN19810_c0_g1_i2:118-462(-)
MEEAIERCESRETESSVSEESSKQLAAGLEADVRGKHRKLAELQKLNQEIRYLEEEIEELDKLERATNACKEMLVLIDNRPDPLLPVTKGPENPAWDRWFEGPVEADGCRCWIS